MTFYVGQKVVCLRDLWRHAQLDKFICPRAGAEYVIRSIITDEEGMVGLRFHWLHNPVVEFSNCVAEPTFAAVGVDGLPNFRPVVERETDISIFTEILDRVNGDKPRVREVEHQS